VKKRTYAQVFFMLALIALPSIGMGAFAHESGKKYSLTIDGRPVSFDHPLYAEDQDAYLSVDDIFDYYGYDKQTNGKTKISSYRSDRNFFTVEHDSLAVKINGTGSAVALKAIEGEWFIHVKDLVHILPLTVTYYKAANQWALTTRWETDVVELLDGVRVFPVTGSFGFANNKAWIGIYTLPNVLPESDVFVNPGNVEISSPIDGSYTKISFDGAVEYRPAGAAQSAVYTYDKAAMQAGAGDNLRLSVDLISMYTSYTVTTAQDTLPGKPLYYIHVQSAWKEAGQKDPALLILPDSSAASGDIPLGSVAAEQYEPPARDTHPSVRDSGYILNTAMMDDLAAEINRLRVNAGLPALVVNHSLVYKKQNDVPGRTTAFDNLRWCREYLGGRTLEHILPAPGMGEILMSDFETGVSAAMVVKMWSVSPIHNAVIMDRRQQAVGVCVVQYPNGDQDAVGTFAVG
jgi:uncharacterized protein YkwD